MRLAILAACAFLGLAGYMSYIHEKHIHENVVCDLPEEYTEISKDSTKPTEMIAYYRGKKIIFGFKH